MIDDFLNRYVNKTGLTRHNLSSNISARNVSDIVIYPFLGDLHSCFFIGQTLFEKQINSKKYNIVLSYPGTGKIFNGADEVWCLNPSYNYQALHNYASGLENSSPSKNVLLRSLNENFTNVDNLNFFKQKYNHSINKSFYNEKNFLVKSLPILSANQLKGVEKSNKKKVLLFPSKFTKNIQENKVVRNLIDPQIYIEVIRRLLSYGYHVFCVQNDWCCNLIDGVGSSEITWVEEFEFDRIISYIHHVGCFMDIFNDLHILGLMAQVPTFSLYERSFYVDAKKDVEHSIFDFTGLNEIFFSFLFLCKKDINLNMDFINNIIDRFDEFYQQKVFVNNKTLIGEKNVDISPFIKKQVLRYKPKFISTMIKRKEREKYEESKCKG